RSRAPSWSGTSRSRTPRWERRSLQARRHLDNFDWILFFAIAVVCAVGVGVIYSATTGTPMAGAFHRQLAWLGLGFLVMLLAIVIDYHTLAEFSYVFYALALVLLALTLAFGRVVNASKSWLGVGGFQFQPSEIAKGATILLLAAYLGRERAPSDRPGLGFVNFSSLCGIVGLPVFLVMMQPDLGTAGTFMPLLVGATFL